MASSLDLIHKFFSDYKFMVRSWFLQMNTEQSLQGSSRNFGDSFPNFMLHNSREGEGVWLRKFCIQKLNMVPKKSLKLTF